MVAGWMTDPVSVGPSAVDHSLGSAIGRHIPPGARLGACPLRTNLYKAGYWTVAMAWVAIPSRRPAKPRPSVVVAFTLTRSSDTFSKEARRGTMEER